MRIVYCSAACALKYNYTFQSSACALQHNYILSRNARACAMQHKKCATARAAFWRWQLAAAVATAHERNATDVPSLVLKSRIKQCFRSMAIAIVGSISSRSLRLATGHDSAAVRLTVEAEFASVHAHCLPSHAHSAAGGGIDDHKQPSGPSLSVLERLFAKQSTVLVRRLRVRRVIQVVFESVPTGIALRRARIREY